MNIKDYNLWHKLKTLLHNEGSRVFFHEREVWWCSIGMNVGFEQDGKGESFARPVLVFRKFNNEIFWAIPLTTKIKTGKYYLPVDLGDGIQRAAIISQLRLVDSKRLYQKIGVLGETEYDKLIEAVIAICKGP